MNQSSRPCENTSQFLTSCHWDLYSILASAWSRVCPYVFYLPQPIKCPNNIITITSEHLLCARHCSESFISTHFINIYISIIIIIMSPLSSVTMCLVAILYNMKLLTAIFLCKGALPKIPNTYYKSVRNIFSLPQPFRESQYTLAWWKSWEAL